MLRPDGWATFQQPACRLVSVRQETASYGVTQSLNLSQSHCDLQKILLSQNTIKAKKSINSLLCRCAHVSAPDEITWFHHFMTGGWLCFPGDLNPPRRRGDSPLWAPQQAAACCFTRTRNEEESCLCSTPNQHPNSINSWICIGVIARHQPCTPSPPPPLYMFASQTADLHVWCFYFQLKMQNELIRSCILFKMHSVSRQFLILE